ncbi:hypothetical protein CGZ93_17845 [Enemella dayhoffiae]|uniref:HNH endonuclease n=1 Tax=Enemella dayhoffiae TaxID=2016507 RepID=A0A255GQF7_9ACTN|nr:hypothetical protein CGZ93_17845 [Enemella dayhoffiae]
MPRPGSTTDRGYGSTHQLLKADWQRRIDAGTRVLCHATTCLHPGQPITGRAWDLGHTPDRTSYTGPEHQDCNRADGGRRAHAPHVTPIYRTWGAP